MVQLPDFVPRMHETSIGLGTALIVSVTALFLVYKVRSHINPGPELTMYSIAVDSHRYPLHSRYT